MLLAITYSSNIPGSKVPIDDNITRHIHPRTFSAADSAGMCKHRAYVPLIMEYEKLTIDAGVVRLYVCALDLAVFNGQSIALASVVPKDGSRIESQVESFGEFASGVTQETDLARSSVREFNVLRLADLLQSSQSGPASCPKQPFCSGSKY